MEIYNKARMFNKIASDPKNKAGEILDALGLKKGQRIADIGAGGGYFSLRFAELVGGKGCVYAVDTNPEFLEFIRKEAEKKQVGNLKTILVEKELILPKGSLDLIFLRNVCHHLLNRVEYFRKLRSLLKSDGRIVIIEYKPGGFFSFHTIFGHYVPQDVIIKEMEEAGYRVERKFDFLPEQSFTIFKPRKEARLAF
ncbi:MAG: methyltransferase domain-containing protein [Candidatus Micrarchaeia archaeon]